jgi:hypothetical protein
MTAGCLARLAGRLQGLALFIPIGIGHRRQPLGHILKPPAAPQPGGAVLRPSG